MSSSPASLRLSVLAGLLLTASCGRIDTTVGAEVAPAAAPDAGAFRCTADLSGVGTGDFRISFTLNTTQTGLAAVLNQRGNCGPSTFWDVRMDDGALLIEVDDVAHYTKFRTTGPRLDDGADHDVSVERLAGTVSVSIDGVPVGSQTSQASLGALEPLLSRTEVCVTSTDGTLALSGQLTNVCVARR